MTSSETPILFTIKHLGSSQKSERKLKDNVVNEMYKEYIYFYTQLMSKWDRAIFLCTNQSEKRITLFFVLLQAITAGWIQGHESYKVIMSF